MLIYRQPGEKRQISTFFLIIQYHPPTRKNGVILSKQKEILIIYKKICRQNNSAMIKLRFKKMPAPEATPVSYALNTVFSTFIEPECNDFGRISFSRYADPVKILERCRDGNEVWMLMDGNVIAAIGEFTPAAHITILFVLPKYQGTGAGRKLFDYLANRIKEKSSGEKTVKITVNAVPKAQGFYQALGFKATEGEKYIEGIPSIPMSMEIKNEK